MQAIRGQGIQFIDEDLETKIIPNKYLLGELMSILDFSFLGKSP